MSSMQQLSRGKHNKIRWVLSNYAQNLCCNLWAVMKQPTILAQTQRPLPSGLVSCHSK